MTPRKVYLAPVMIVALAAEILLGISLFFQKQTLSMSAIIYFISLHIISSVLSSEALGHRYSDDKAKSYALWRMGFMLGLLLPFIGALINFFLFIFAPKIAHAISSDEPSPMQLREKQARLQFQNFLRSPTATFRIEPIQEPIQELIQEPIQGREHEIAEILRAMGDKKSVSLLKTLSRHESRSMSTEAVETMTEMSNRFSYEIAKASEALSQEPTQTRYCQLAALYVSYADLEIEPVEIQISLYHQAIHFYSEALRMNHMDAPDVFSSFRSPDVIECRKVVKHLQQRIYGEKAGVAQLLDLARIQFEKKEFRSLKETCHAIFTAASTHAQLSTQELNAVSHWAKSKKK